MSALDAKPAVMPKSAKSREGMVVSPHPLATEAGLAVLQAGGTPMEAMVAAGAVLTVVCPHFCGLGGDAVWLAADKTGRRTTFLGIGQAAARLPHFTGPIPERGAQSALTTACIVDCWESALGWSASEWGGRRSLGDLLGPAMAHAKNGYPVTRSQTHWLNFRREQIGDWPGFADVFLHDGKMPEPGSIFSQPALARTLTRIAADGARSFYEGALAEDIAAGLADAGVPLTQDDLAATKTRIAPPVKLAYRGWELLAPPPPTQGITTLEIMACLRNFEIGSLNPSGPEILHLCIEAVKQAFLDRDGIADPDFSDAMRIMDRDNLDWRASQIDPKRALPWPHAFQSGDTVYLAAADKDGRWVSGLQSTYFDWGSGVVVGDTGILWQNRGAAFNTIEGHPNRIAPGKRPFYTLNPGIAHRADGSVHLYGTQGADGQPQTLAVLLARLLDHGQSPDAALAAPRFLLGRTFSDQRKSLKLERSVGEHVAAELSALGHEVALIEALSQLAGQAGVISIDGAGLMSGAHDPRGEGTALGLGQV